jgi:hypothetical protein
MIKQALFVALALALALGTSAMAKGMLATRVTPEELERRVADSPVIKLVGAKRFAAQPAGTQIELYYKKFGFLGPEGIENWEYHYKMGEPGAPTWKYTRIAEVIVYRADHSDPHAVIALKKAAAELGGDAIVNLQREPVFAKGGYNWAEKTLDVIGYMYYGDVVRRKP